MRYLAREMDEKLQRHGAFYGFEPIEALLRSFHSMRTASQASI